VRGRRLLAGIVLALGMLLVPCAAAMAQDTLTVQCTSGGQTAECNSSWYMSSVTVVWKVDSNLQNPLSGCVQDVTYIYASDGVSNLSCTATWADTGNSTTLSLKLHVEVSSPTATATPSRPPDANGWYNHPVSVSFAGSSFSGISSCTPGQTYAGPDTAGVTLSGSCTDLAGKTAPASYALQYDATPPSLNISADAGDQSVGLTWQAASGPAPVAAVQITRSPGFGRAGASLLSQQSPGTYDDTRVRNKVRYTYTVTVVDQAGLSTTRSIGVMPAERLLAPAGGAHVSGPPLLSWTAVPKATYYNVQLYRGRQVFSAWPKRASLQLSRTWRFGGRQHRLKPGRYRWYVWPGLGPRSKAHYGPVVGTATFIVR
jgi:hypothetical protein